MSKPKLPDMRGAIALPDPGTRKVFMPPSAIEVRRVRAANIMNRSPELTKAWALAMGGLTEAMDEGADVVEGVVPRGGADVLGLLGFHAQFLCEQGEADVVRVCLTDPFVTKAVMS